MRASTVLLTALASLLPAFGMVSQADAATFTVTRMDDPSPDGCLPADCSLREAVMAANGEAGSTISLPAGEYTLSIPGIDDEFYDERIGDLDIRVAMTITGAGAVSTLIQQAGALDRVFDARSTTMVTLAHMTVRNGGGNAHGGCIRNTGRLTIDSVTVAACTSSQSGGGISNRTTVAATVDLFIRRSTVTGNVTQGLGGGVAASATSFASVNLKVYDSVISNNTASSFGGGIQANGGIGIHFDNGHATLEMRNSTLAGNTAFEGGGLSLSGLGSRAISDASVRDNTARRGGGGIATTYELLRIERSTFSGNRAGVGCVGAECDSSSGGAITASSVEVNNSTFSDNACGPGQVSGGAIRTTLHSLRVANSTFTSNTCRLGAALAFPADSQPGMQATLKNTILANNTATDASGGDCAGVITSQGYNVVGNVTGCTFAPATGDLIGVDPQLGPLQDNGGPTDTHALSATSPARNAGHPSGCTDTAGALLQSDQRGYARPQEGRCDIGAFEYGIDALVVYRLRHPSIGAYLFTLYTSERDSAQRQYGYVYEGICCNWLAAPAVDRAPLYRLFSSTAGEYFFTISSAERDGAVSQFGYLFEGTAAYCHPDPGADRTPWFRLRYGNKHFYTIYPEERDAAVANLGYVYEGVACYLPVP